MDWYANPAARTRSCDAAPADVLAFHRQLPGYAPTPLVELPSVAAELNVRRLLVKDESSRLGLPAFKVLGASWAVARLVAARAGLRGPLTLDRLRAAVGPLTLVTATDGNHGRAVARMARLLGAAAHVLVPDVVPDRAARLIADEGAKVTTLPGPYDQTVAEAARVAAGDPDAELVQDTAWPGYETVPGWVVEGYATLPAEIGPVPDLVVVPIGVGSLAQAVVTHYRSGGRAAAVLGVEPETAACVLASLRAGRRRSVRTGATVMAGLNCGTPSSLAWPVLRDGLDAAVAVSDDQASRAVADLGDLGVSSGPSGAATLAAARAALGEEARRAALRVGPEATVVLLSTEGRA
ncbi:MAG: diaminopropionate ammonia-lyase [Mycobacteriales bacterium]